MDLERDTLRPGAAELGGWDTAPHWDADWVNGVEQVEDEEAIAMTLRLAREEGIFAGHLHGRERRRVPAARGAPGPRAIVVTLAVDSGFKYMSSAPSGAP